MSCDFHALVYYFFSNRCIKGTTSCLIFSCKIVWPFILRHTYTINNEGEMKQFYFGLISVVEYFLPYVLMV